MTKRALSVSGRMIFGSGELTLNTSLVALTLVYMHFLLQEAELRPVLAGLVPLIGRAVDAISDPLMGRLSDRVRWRSGRRRPWFLIGAVPYGLAFFALWWEPPLATQAARFAYYAAAYSLFSLTITVLYVPYLALLPEMASDYDERTSLSAYRTAMGSCGMLGAIGLRALAEALGGETPDFAAAAALYGLLLSLPWIAVHRVTFEPPLPATPPTRARLFDGFGEVLRHASFRELCAIYVLGRIAMDMIGALFVLYAEFWLGRADDFVSGMLLFFVAALASYPIGVRLTRRLDKPSVYVIGVLVWGAAGCLLWFVQPEHPRVFFFAVLALHAPGFALIDLIPWSIVGDVADEGQLQTGERRDGVYNGVLSFARKLGGALGLFVVMSFLDAMGYVEGADAQSESARGALRLAISLGPILPLAVGGWLASRFSLRRSDHERIRRQL